MLLELKIVEVAKQSIFSFKYPGRLALNTRQAFAFIQASWHRPGPGLCQCRLDRSHRPWPACSANLQPRSLWDLINLTTYFLVSDFSIDTCSLRVWFIHALVSDYSQAVVVLFCSPVHHICASIVFFVGTTECFQCADLFELVHDEI